MLSSYGEAMLCQLCNVKVLRVVSLCLFLAVPSRTVVAEPLISFNSRAATTSQPTASQQLRIDHNVKPAGLPSAPSDQANATDDSHRLLAPPTRNRSAAPTDHRIDDVNRAPAFAMPKIESFATAGAGLAIVVGLFLVCMWLLRRSGPKPTSPLPNEVVAVLGRVPLAARNFAHLLRVGNKLVLVAITPDGVSPITEITDPTEVQQLLGLCHRNHKHSTSTEFHTVLEQLAQEPAKGFLGNEVAASYVSQKR